MKWTCVWTDPASSCLSLVCNWFLCFISCLPSWTDVTCWHLNDFIKQQSVLLAQAPLCGFRLSEVKLWPIKRHVIPRNPCIVESGTTGLVYRFSKTFHFSSKTRLQFWGFERFTSFWTSELKKRLGWEVKRPQKPTNKPPQTLPRYVIWLQHSFWGNLTILVTPQHSLYHHLPARWVICTGNNAPLLLLILQKRGGMGMSKLYFTTSQYYLPLQKKLEEQRKQVWVD